MSISELEDSRLWAALRRACEKNGVSRPEARRMVGRLERVGLWGEHPILKADLRRFVEEGVHGGLIMDLREELKGMRREWGDLSWEGGGGRYGDRRCDFSNHSYSHPEPPFSRERSHYMGMGGGKGERPLAWEMRDIQPPTSFREERRPPPPSSSRDRFIGQVRGRAACEFEDEEEIAGPMGVSPRSFLPRQPEGKPQEEKEKEEEVKEREEEEVKEEVKPLIDPKVSRKQAMMDELVAKGFDFPEWIKTPLEDMPEEEQVCWDWESPPPRGVGMNPHAWLTRHLQKHKIGSAQSLLQEIIYASDEQLESLPKHMRNLFKYQCRLSFDYGVFGRQEFYSPFEGSVADAKKRAILVAIFHLELDPMKEQGRMRAVAKRAEELETSGNPVQDVNHFLQKTYKTQNLLVWEYKERETGGVKEFKAIADVPPLERSFEGEWMGSKKKTQQSCAREIWKVLQKKRPTEGVEKKDAAGTVLKGKPVDL